MDTHHDLPPALKSPPLTKRRFDVDAVLARLEVSAAALPPTLHAALYAAGYRSVFQHVAVAILAARTPDAAARLASESLFRWAPTAERVHRLKIAQVEALIDAVPFARAKAERLKEIARIAVEKYGGDLPGRERILRALPGIGATCVNLVLGLVAEQDKLTVGSHVARVTRRWGLVTATSTSGIESQLAQKIPRETWRFFGEWVVAFGAHVCTRERPQCTECPLLIYCRQVGVEDIG